MGLIKKFVGDRKAPFMTRKLKKATMVRSSLRKTFLKYPTNKNRIDQRNLCVGLLEKEKKINNKNLDVNNLNDYKTETLAEISEETKN